MSKLNNPVMIIAVTAVFALSTVGCGTILYPERKHATPSDKIHGKTLVLDCLWLFAGVIPGVVALGVDFYNDTIYLSEGELRAEKGDIVSIDIHGPAPADSEVTLRVVDATGCNLTCSGKLRARDVKNGDTPLTVEMPSEIYFGGTKLILAVDGRDQVVWNVQPKSAPDTP